MKNNITEMVFILDRSGSMSGLEADTVGGFNTMLEKQKKETGRAYISTVLFNSDTFVLHDRADVANVRKMEISDFQPSGCTALFDAIGGAIRHISNIHKYARPEDVPEKTVFVITTDGMENASRIYSREQVKRMIEDKKKENGWEFLFVAANIDAQETAASFGVPASRAVNYCADSTGTEKLYACVGQTISNLRQRRKIDDNWKEAIDEDYQKRK